MAVSAGALAAALSHCNNNQLPDVVHVLLSTVSRLSCPPAVPIMKLTPITAQIRELQYRINSLSDRLTSNIDQHHHGHEESLMKQLTDVSSKVETLLNGREKVTEVANKLASIESLLLMPDIASGESEAKVKEELLLLEEDVVRAEAVYYAEIKRLEPVLDQNHLSADLSEDVIADLTAKAEQDAAAARQIREETDQLMQFNADLNKCMDDMLAEWDKRIKRITLK